MDKMSRQIIDADLLPTVFPMGIKLIESSILRIGVDSRNRYWLHVYRDGSRRQSGMIYNPPHVGSSLTPTQIGLIIRSATKWVNERQHRTRQLLKVGFGAFFSDLTIDPTTDYLDVHRKPNYIYQLVAIVEREYYVDLGPGWRLKTTLTPEQWNLVKRFSFKI